jgi:HlyD family secretion protein
MRYISILAIPLLLSACKPSGKNEPEFTTTTVRRGDITRHVTASGTLGALISVDIGSQVSGSIMALHADFNSTVRKGQVIAEIDSSVYNASLRQSEGELASALADVELKKQNLARKTLLAPSGAASRLDLDQATAQLAQAEAAVAIKQAIVDGARANVGFCRITSPVDGIVISRKVDVGQTLIAAMTTPVLFTIAQDITRMNIKASISEADIGQLKEGQPVDFTVDAYPDETFQGTVSQVRKSPTTTQNVVTYETMISVENPDQKLFPGMTAEVSIRVSQRENVLKLANAALRYSPPEGAKFAEAPSMDLGRNQRLVYRIDAGSPLLRPVMVRAGISDGVETEVTEGLKENEAVVTSTLTAKERTVSAFPPKRPIEPPP